MADDRRLRRLSNREINSSMRIFEIAQVERMSSFDLARRIIEIYNSENATVTEYNWLIAKSKDDYAKHIIGKALSSRQVNYMNVNDMNDALLDDAGELAQALNILSEIEHEHDLRTTTKLKQATDEYLNSADLRKLAQQQVYILLQDEYAEETLKSSKIVSKLASRATRI